MTETKAERYVTYAEFDDFKKHDSQEVRDDIKDIRSDLSEMKGDIKVLNASMKQMIDSKKFYKTVLVLAVLVPVANRLLSFFFEH